MSNVDDWKRKVPCARARAEMGRDSSTHSKVPTFVGHGDAASVMELTPEVTLSGVAAADSRRAVTSTPQDSSTTRAVQRAGHGDRGLRCIRGRGPLPGAASGGRSHSRFTVDASGRAARAVPSRRVPGDQDRPDVVANLMLPCCRASGSSAGSGLRIPGRIGNSRCPVPSISCWRPWRRSQRRKDTCTPLQACCPDC